VSTLTETYLYIRHVLITTLKMETPGQVGEWAVTLSTPLTLPTPRASPQALESGLVRTRSPPPRAPPPLGL
jgi:hypothetical protein